MSGFLHGVETIELTGGARPIRTPRSAVIALVGIAPTGPQQALTLVNNEADAAAFGKQVRGYSIPQALAAIAANGGATCLVVNVFNPSTMTTNVSAESRTITNRRIKVSQAGYVSLTSITTSGGSPTTLTANTDYTINEFGEALILNGNYADGTTLVMNYKIVDTAAITASLINGAVDGTTGVRTGMKLLAQAYSLFGFTPKIIIAPWYSQLAGVQTEMVTQANALRAMALLDTVEGLTPANVLTERGPGGDVAVANKNAVILYPWLKFLSPDTNTNTAIPFSAVYAGVIAGTDAELGYWYSPSNRPILGITGVERRLVGNGVTDANAEWNLLNEAGVTTIFEAFGTGVRAWGNRTSAYPVFTAPDDSFVAVRRVEVMLHEAVEQAMLQFVDQPINQAFIDSVRETVNAYLRTLIGRGAIVDGECTYLTADNPPTELAAGHITFRLTFMPPTPAERITFNSFVDINLLQFK